MRSRFLFVLMILMVACNSGDDNQPQSGLEGANQRQRSTEVTRTPTPVPTVDVVEAAVETELALQNVPPDLNGALYLTLNNDLYNVSLEGKPAELLLSEAVVHEVRESMAYYHVETEDGSRTYYRLNLGNGETAELFHVEDGQLANFRRWSPNGQWFVVEIGQIDEVIVNRNLISTQFERFEVLETQVYDSDGRQVNLPVPEVTDGLKYSVLFLTDSTLLVKATTTRVGNLFNLWHVDQFTDQVRKIEIELGQQMTFSRVFDLNFLWQEAIDIVNEQLAAFGLEIAPPTDAQLTPSTLAPDEAFRIEIETSNSNSTVCQDYFVMQEPEQELFLPRQLDSFQAIQVSKPFVRGTQLLLLRTVSPTCTWGDFALELVHISNFENPSAETLYQATYPAEAGIPALNYLTTPDLDYLLWSAVEAERLVLLVTDISTGETREVMALPYQVPDLETVQSGPIFNLLAVTERS